MSAQRSNKNSRRPPFSPARAGGDASLPPRGLAAMPAWTRSVCTLSAALQSSRLARAGGELDRGCGSGPGQYPAPAAAVELPRLACENFAVARPTRRQYPRSPPRAPKRTCRGHPAMFAFWEWRIYESVANAHPKSKPGKMFFIFPGVFPSKFAGCLLMNEGQRSPLRVRWPVPETK